MWKSSNVSPNIGGDELEPIPQVEPIIGYRIWRVVSGIEGLHLRSLHMSYMWQEENEAKCLAGQSLMRLAGKHPGEPAPDVSCSCGIYAQLPEHPLAEWQSSIRGGVHATGTIVLYGKVIVCEKGYKAQYAQIQSPVIIEAQCSQRVKDGGLTRPCEAPISRLLPQPGGAYKAYCHPHLSFLGAEDSKDLIPAKPWLKVACRELSGQYPNIDFLTWSML
jgi:hypothetical protein